MQFCPGRQSATRAAPHPNLRFVVVSGLSAQMCTWLPGTRTHDQVPWGAQKPQDQSKRALLQGEHSEDAEAGHADRAWVNLAPVEAMLEGDTGVTDTIHAAKQGASLHLCAPCNIRDEAIMHPCCTPAALCCSTAADG